MHMTWLQAIQKVLSEANSPLHYTEISERALQNKYIERVGATPSATVSTTLSNSINRDKESPFIRVGMGMYALKQSGEVSSVSTNTDDRNTPVAVKNAIKHETTTVAKQISDIDQSESVIRCIGMYWQRSLVVWKNVPTVFGKQQATSKPIDFSGQLGIYILYDNHTVVYVGRSVERPLGRRLYEHTIDRLGCRWDRFSWFGLLDVTDEGLLIDVPIKTTMSSLISTLESLLIEAMEPPQNRKRGDNFSVIEYIQEIDPKLKKNEMRATLLAFEKHLADL